MCLPAPNSLSVYVLNIWHLQSHLCSQFQQREISVKSSISSQLFTHFCVCVCVCVGDTCFGTHLCMCIVQQLHCWQLGIELSPLSNSAASCDGGFHVTAWQCNNMTISGHCWPKRRTWAQSCVMNQNVASLGWWLSNLDVSPVITRFFLFVFFVTPHKFHAGRGEGG